MGLLQQGLSRIFPPDKNAQVDWQKVAAFAAVKRRFCVITGGPGTGKTTTVAKILALLVEQSKGAETPDSPRFADRERGGPAPGGLEESQGEPAFRPGGEGGHTGLKPRRFIDSSGRSPVLRIFGGTRKTISPWTWSWWMRRPWWTWRSCPSW